MKGSKPDIDNYNKSFFDALTGNDELIGQRSGDGKFWFNPDLVEKKLRGGYIEVVTNLPLHNPYNVELINPYKSIEMEDIESRRKKLRARKEELKAEKKQLVVKKVKPLKMVSQKTLFQKKDKIK